MNPSSSVVWGDRPFRAPGARGAVVRISLALEAVVGVAMTVAAFIAARSEGFVTFPGTDPNLAEPASPFSLYPSPMGSVVWIASIVSIVTWVSWLVWQHRAQANAWAMPSSTRPRMTPGWAVGWWFVPVANLFMPFLGVRELARRSSAGAGEDRRSSHLVLATWWLCWIAATLLSIGGFGAFFGEVFSRIADVVDPSSNVIPPVAIPVSELGPSLQIIAFSFALRSAAAALGILVVGDIERDQRAFDRSRTVVPPRPDGPS